MILAEPPPDEDTDGDEALGEASGSSFFEKTMRLDREVILFAILLTSYAAVRNINQTVVKSSQPKPFFTENPWVNDFYRGEIHEAFGLASKEDITFVMYYAPWDADCQRAKPIFEKVARYYHKQVHFMAINCWEPSSVCKAHFSKIKSYPVFMIYLQRSKGVEYQGLIDFGHMTYFLSSIITPLHRIHNVQMLKNLRSTYDAVVLAYIPFTGMFGGESFHSYYRASLKYLEVDPRRDTVFAIMTHPSMNENTFYHYPPLPSSGPSIKLYLWNSTVEFNRIWDTANIVKWVHESTQKITSWAYPPGVKSNLLAQFISSGPTVILFTPRNMFLSHSHEYNLLKLATLHYYDCYSGTDFKDFHGTLYSLLFFMSSNDQWKSMKALKQKCSSKALKRDHVPFSKPTKWTNSSQKCSYLSDYQDLSNDNSFHSLCEHDSYTSFLDRSSRFHDSEFNDEFSAEALQYYKLKSDCRKMRFAFKYLPDDWLENKELHLLQRKSGTMARSLGCNANATLSFLAMDSSHFEHFASNLGITLNDKYAQTAVFIIDSKEEAIYHLNSTYLSLDLLEQFIYNFTRHNLTRFLRSSDAVHSSTVSDNSLVETISSNTFNDRVINNNRTVMVYFYSSFCGYSQTVYHTFLLLANTLKSLDEHVSFVRIDGENNDLEWPFSIDKYPSIILFPSADKSNSKLFSRRSKITSSNLSKFILFNLGFELRAQAHILFCLNQIFSDFHSVSDCINNFRLSTINFLNHYNNQLRNTLIHYKLQADKFQNTTNISFKFKRRKNDSMDQSTLAEASQNLIAKVNKIKCKLLYFQIINSYLNSVNFTRSDVVAVSKKFLVLYRMYLGDFSDISKSSSISCSKLRHTLKNLQGRYSSDKDTLVSFQKSKSWFRNALNTIQCNLKLARAAQRQNSTSERFVDSDLNLNEHSYLVTNDFPFDAEKEEEEPLSARELQKEEEIATNRILNGPSQNTHEEEGPRGHATVDEL